ILLISFSSLSSFSLPLYYVFFSYSPRPPRHLHSFPTRRSSDLRARGSRAARNAPGPGPGWRSRSPATIPGRSPDPIAAHWCRSRSEEHTSELQSRFDLVCRLLLEKKKLNNRCINEYARHIEADV